jgi:hypothetical protein
VVKVGGGYVMFEEYCRKYSGGSLDHPGHLGVAISSGRPGFNVSGSGPAGLTPRASTPRTARGAGLSGSFAAGAAGSPNGSMTPRGQPTPRRVLVRQGRGVVLH